MQIDMNNIWTLFRLAKHFAERDAFWNKERSSAKPATPQDHAPNHWDYSKRIHRQGHGWKANHEGNT